MCPVFVPATLLSCLKGLGMEYSVYSVRRAIMATAEAMTTPGADPFAVGSGMLRVSRLAWVGDTLNLILSARLADITDAHRSQTTRFRSLV